MASIINASTSGAGGVITTADASGVLNIQTAGTTALAVSASQVVTIPAAVNLATTSGNVGIGTASPTANLEIYGASSPYQIVGNGTQQAFLGVDGAGGFSGTLSNHAFALRTNNTDRMTIATDGTITSTLGGMQVRSGTAVAATGTAIDFTGIPSWVRRITVMFDAVSTNGASNILVRLGTAASGILTTGYASTGSAIQGTAVGANSFTTGFAMSNTDGASASYVRYGQMTISRQREDQIWTFSSILGVTGAASARTEHGAGAGSTAGGALDRIRITTANGTDTFDIGFFNILFE